MSAPLLAIVGPTGAGKSAVAMQLAAASGGEILSCDSVQVYRGFAIGCAKPSAADRARVPHHGLDLVDWNEPFDAARWAAYADDVVADCRRRGVAPILCGGTGLYLRALRFGLIDVPPADAALRARLEAEERRTPGALYARLRRVDPEGAARIEPHNLVHVIRALEISAAAGEPASVVRRRHGFAAERLAVRVVYLRWPDAELRRRIEARAAAMVGAGLADEVAGLLDRGVSPDCRPMGAVGYREACAVVRGEAAAAGLAERIAAATWRYAKRQRTWFRKEPGVEVIDVESLAAVPAALGAA